MLIHLSEALSTEGATKEYEAELTLTTFQSGSDSYPVTEKRPVRLLIHNEGNKVLTIEGNVFLTIRMSCDRCLTDVLHTFDFSFTREVDMKETEEERMKNLDEQPYIEGFQLNVDALIESELFLHMPMKVLCKEDCKGICNRCGANLNRETCSCDDEPKDPRMAAILDIFKAAAEK